MKEDMLGRAFCIEKRKGVNLRTPPSSGEEFVQQVMFEASRVNNFVARNPNNIVPGNVDSQGKCFLDKVVPIDELEVAQVAEFSSMRQKIIKYKEKMSFPKQNIHTAPDELLWKKVLFGETPLKPLLSIVLPIKQLVIVKVLSYHIEWMKNGLKPNQGVWIYALMACIELPLSSNMCSVLRDLARQCLKIKASQVSQTDEVIALNLIVCLVIKYFGQKDLINERY